jgi:hypothetical protein
VSCEYNLMVFVSVVGMKIVLTVCCWVMNLNMLVKKTIKAKILNGLVPYFVGVPVDAPLLLVSPQPGMILGMFL